MPGGGGSGRSGSGGAGGGGKNKLTVAARESEIGEEKTVHISPLDVERAVREIGLDWLLASGSSVCRRRVDASTTTTHSSSSLDAATAAANNFSFDAQQRLTGGPCGDDQGSQVEL